MKHNSTGSISGGYTYSVSTHAACTVCGIIKMAEGEARDIRMVHTGCVVSLSITIMAEGGG